MCFCKYKDYLGKPGEGVHSYRFFDIAIIDVLFTIIGAYIISNVINASFINILFILIILGIIAHRIFCVDTTIDKLIFQ